MDRKSKFEAHLAVVSCQEQVECCAFDSEQLYISFNNISNILRYFYATPPRNSRKCGGLCNSLAPRACPNIPYYYVWGAL